MIIIESNIFNWQDIIKKNKIQGKNHILGKIKKSPLIHIVIQGASIGNPAVSYSPTQSPMQYHRR
jgi:hypothetical protein